MCVCVCGGGVSLLLETLIQPYARELEREPDERKGGKKVCWKRCQVL